MAGAALCWSSGGLLARLVGTDAWTTVFWRGLFCAAFLLTIVAVRNRRARASSRLAFGWAGVAMAACFATASTCFINALARTSVANALVIQSTSPFIAALAGWLWMGERVRRRSWLAMAAALLGTVVMAWRSWVVDRPILSPLPSGHTGGDAVEGFRPSDAVLVELVRRHIPNVRLKPLSQKAIPRLAKDVKAVRAIDEAIRRVPTRHRLVLGDSRSLSAIDERTVDLVVTSPPYFNLKKYPDHERQLGAIDNYDLFLKELDDVWLECHRVLVPGGRLIIVVGDVCRSRRAFGAHMVIPLHASIAEHCRQLGFHNLATVVWHKISNAKFEVENGTAFLGKPYEPNAVIKNDLEYLLMLRKAGGYRQPTEAMRVLSLISAKRHKNWFNQIVTVRGASTRSHPAPYPVELVEPLIRMFSFVGDTVLDPFLGTGTTTLAAARSGRNSIGIEIEPAYHHMACDRLTREAAANGLNAVVDLVE